MKYKCCNCTNIFPAEAAVDGYSRGITRGFLCPKCGCNIEDNGKSVHVNVVILLAPIFIALCGFDKYPTGFEPNYTIIFGGLSLYAIAIPWVLYRVYKNRNKPIGTIKVEI